MNTFYKEKNHRKKSFDILKRGQAMQITERIQYVSRLFSKKII